MKDYKKLYEDANKRVATRFGSDVARELFQDLYESENEKIRKEIIEFISQYSQGSFNLGIKDITFKKWLAWLEKQGKQNVLQTPTREMILAVWELGNIWKELTHGVCFTEYGLMLDYIQKHWKESEYYLRAKQGSQNLANSAKTCKDEQKPADKIDPCSDCTNDKGCINCENGNLKETEKSAWSEEDEKIIETMCKEGDLRPSQMIWLKSLKNRVQPRQEWNENDKEQLDRAIYMMGQLGLTKSWDDVYNWLKSLKDRI